MCLFDRPIIAVDFDGVIRKESCASVKSNEIMPDCEKYLWKLVEAGCELILWTCRTKIDDPELYHASIGWAYDFLTEHNGIIYLFFEYNENSKQLPWSTSGKIYADYYLDDKNLGGFPGWKKAYEIIMQDEYFKRGQYVRNKGQR